MSDQSRCPTPEQLTQMMEKHFPGRNTPRITQATTGYITLEYDCSAMALRPGGFISGPTQMAIADTVGLMGVFSHTGLSQPAFTTNLNIDFLRPAVGEKLLAEGRVARFGRTLCVINVTMRGSAMEKPSAQAVVTYATGSGAG